MTHSLDTLLDDLCTALIDLQAVQSRELEAVVQHQHKQVAALAAEKASLTDKIQALDNQVAQHFTQQSVKDDPALQGKVNRAQELLDTCKQQNAVNEQVVNTTLNNIEQLKQQILKSARGDTMTYDSQGKFR
ncbi:flagellar biosynthesis protein FlgN [Idiomarina tyrosinivorans]|uniref:Flagellar biosynthesis protein FlgN n=1 Tax=Idiomarina tyrosinivorans TaxID=1445662 RepID=A0A432ZPM8_9GAMM|nr:flagellar export chaperone FlgN [Idiomarina tyrosinivorans]RUO79847.1 flagellar biosynthesis protein FlgN [Idiomarina tyrosinivorans]